MSLPPEILEIIFKQLDGRSLQRMRGVCRQWKEVVDGFSDNIWKELCEKDFKHANCSEAYHRADITWCQLYQSFSLWNKVTTAAVRASRLSTEPLLEHAKGVYLMSPEILANNTLSVFVRDFNLKKSYNMNFDLEKLKPKDLLPFERPFDERHESSDLMALVYNDQLQILSKKSKTLFPQINYLRRYVRGVPYEVHPLGTRVYFVNSAKKLCVLELKNEGDEEKLMFEMLFPIENYIVKMACDPSDSESFNVLVSQLEGEPGKLYRLKDKKLELICSVPRFTHCIAILERHGFKWYSGYLYNWLIHKLRNQDYDCDYEVRIGRTKNACLCTSGHAFIVGAWQRKVVHFYSNAYKSTGGLRFLDQPDRTVMLEKLFVFGDTPSKMQVTSIEVVEMVNGHNVIVSVEDGSILIIELDHGAIALGTHAGEMAYDEIKIVSQSKRRKPS